VLTRDGRLDAMTVRVEAEPGVAGAEQRAALAQELAQHVKGVIRVSVGVEVVDPGAIERSTGKARRVVDLRAKG